MILLLYFDNRFFSTMGHTEILKLRSSTKTLYSMLFNAQKRPPHYARSPTYFGTNTLSASGRSRIRNIFVVPGCHRNRMKQILPFSTVSFRLTR